MQDEAIRLMFMHADEFEEGRVIRGGILVTDGTTKPLEFRCTDPVRPTTLQKVLYGEVLTEEILMNLIGIPLTKSCRERADVIMVRDVMFLSVRQVIDIPVLWIGREQDWQVPSEPATEDDFIVCSAGKFDPVIVKGHLNFPDDAQQIRKKLRAVFENHDLLEPFERIANALKVIHKQKNKSATP